MKIKQQVRDYVVENFLMGKEGEGVADDASFLGEDILDSTGVLELVAFLEQTFGITVADEEMLPENLDSLQAIEAFVLRKRQPA